MDTQRINFTKRALERLPTPAKNTTYHDTERRSLKLVSRPTGTKTFVWYRKVDGRPERITLGRFPTMTVDQARRRTEQLDGRVALDENPGETKRERKSEPTVGLAFTGWLEQHAKQHNKSWPASERRFKRCWGDWENRRLALVSRSDVRARHTQIGIENGKYEANRALSLLKTVLNWAEVAPNPCQGVKPYREQSRRRFLQSDELPRFFAALNEELNTVARDFILLCLLTGARRSNVLAMKWADVSLDRSEWAIPGSEMKGKEDHVIPLVPEAVAILESRKRSRPRKCPWVLPGRDARGDATDTHLNDPKKAWARVLLRAGLEDVRLHDLRRTLGSWQAKTGASLPLIGATLAHTNVATTAIYARLSLDPVRDSVNRATRAMLSAGGVLADEDDKVVSLRDTG